MSGFRVSWVVASVAWVASAGCSANPVADDERLAVGDYGYVGTVSDSDMVVGIATHDGKADVFFCGGATTLDRTTWFRGVTFPSTEPVRKGAVQTTIEATEGEAHGTFVLSDGTSHEWTAKGVDLGGVAGLYDVKDESGVGGVVVAGADSAQGAFLFKDLTVLVKQIIVVSPIDPSERGIPVQVDSRALFAARVRPAP